MGDFTGFSFNGVHINNVRIVRVSDGSRYNDTILPTFTDKTVAVPGGNGTYFFGSYYTQKPFTLQVAFDELTEEDLRTLRQTFNGQVVGDLVFDEQPYKRYIVKVQSAPQLKYLCFDVDEVSNLILPSNANNREMWTLTGTGRVYKGEGTIQFVAYEPFARSVNKELDDYDQANKSEWAASSGMLEDLDGYDTYSSSSSRFKIYNPGDLPTDFKILMTKASFVSLTQIALDSNQLNFGTKVAADITDNYICIDTKANMICGMSDNNLTSFSGNLYNKYIISGDFFKIPVYIGTTAKYLTLTGASGAPTIYYDYLYY